MPQLKLFLEQVVNNAIIYVEYQKKSRISARHFLRAIKRYSRNI